VVSLLAPSVVTAAVSAAAAVCPPSPSVTVSVASMPEGRWPGTLQNTV
jgi:hypothetical protein